MKRLLAWTFSLLGMLLLVVIGVLLFPPERWIADKIESLTLDKSGYTLAIGELELDLLQVRPSATLSDVSVDGVELQGLTELGHVEGAIDLPALLGGSLLIDRFIVRDAMFEARRDADGSTTWAGADRPPSESAGEVNIPAIRRLALENVSLRYDDAVLKRDAELIIDGDASTLAAQPPSTLSAAGTVDGAPADVTLKLSPENGALAVDGGLTLDLKATLADVVASIAGSVGDAQNLTDVDLAIELQADDLDGLEPILRLELPELAPVTISGSLITDGPEYVLKHFDLASTGSTAQGDLRFDPTTTPMSFYANIISETLDVDALIAVLNNFTTDDTDGESETAGSAGKDPSEPATARTSDGRVFPAAPLAFDKVFAPLQGAVNLRIDDVVTESFPLDTIDLGFTFDGQRVAIELKDVGIAGGRIAGKLLLERIGNAEVAATAAEADTPDDADPAGDAPAEGLAAELELEVSAIDITTLLASLEIPDNPRGVLGGKAKYWASGTSVAAIAASLDGGLFLMAEGGQIGDFLIELAGLDLFQAMGDVLTPSDGSVVMRCAYADIQSADGKTDIVNLVIDTSDTVFLGAGTVNLADETLEVSIEPHPKDASLIAGSTALGVSGTLAAPEVDVGVSLPARGAAVAVLAALATPALALLPLIESGGGEDSPYCTNLEGALDDNI